MRLLFAIFLALPLAAQVQVVFTPESMGIAQQLYGPLKEFGVWNVRLFNVGNVPVSLDSARIYIAGAQLGLVSKQHAMIVLHNRRQDRWQSRVLQFGALTTGAATLAVGGYAANGNPSKGVTKAISGLAVATPIFMLIGNALRASIPDISEAEILDGTLTLAARAGMTAIVFARRTSKPQVLEVMIDPK
jgi:hypothetical protein